MNSRAVAVSLLAAAACIPFRGQPNPQSGKDLYSTHARSATEAMPTVGKADPTCSVPDS
jgi:hypothetical protein